MKPFRFIQASDAHLGYMQYNLTERNTDFLKAFEEFIVKTKELSPDFVIFAGDLFHTPHPSNPVLAEAIELIDSLKAPFLVVPGSHDNTYSKLVGTVLEPLHRGGHIHYLPSKPYEKDDTYIYGMTNFRKRNNFTSEASEFFKNHPPNPRKRYNIFALHQGIDFPSLKMHPSQVEMHPEELPKGFQYYASGHIHNPTTLRHDDSKFTYSGSLETFEYTEYEYSKGFYSIDVGRDGEEEIKLVPLSKKRQFRILRQDCTGLKPDEIEEKARKKISDSDAPDIILVMILEGTLFKGLTRVDLDYESIRREAKNALYTNLINHVKTIDEEESLVTEMAGTESMYTKANVKLNEYYIGFFKEKTPRYTELTMELVSILANKELRSVDKKRATESKIDAFYNGD